MGRRAAVLREPVRAVLTGQEARQQSGKGIDGLALLLGAEGHQDGRQQS